MKQFKIEQEIRKSLSLESYIYLINEYIELKNIIKTKYNQNVDNISKLNSTISVLKENNIKIPRKLNSIYLSLSDDSSINECKKLAEDISNIVSIGNLRYLIGDIAEKENLSLEDISLSIGCEANTLDNLVHNKLTIRKSDFEKFISHYGIKEIIEEWYPRYILI